MKKVSNKPRKQKKSRALSVWAIAACFLLAVTITGNYLCHNQLSGLMDTVFGGQRPIYSEDGVVLYPAVNASSKAEALNNAQALNRRVAEEGFVLLKNENGALPVKAGAKISVFGKNSVNLSYGGSGSGGFDTSNNRSLYDSLHAAGFDTNGVLEAFYLDDGASGKPRGANSSDLDSGDNQVVRVGETPASKYTDKVKASYANYRDMALVVITRIGGEGFDLPRHQGDTEGAVEPDSHYLELDQNERDLLTAVCNADFERVVVLFNVPSSFEATFLTDPAYLEVAEKIDAAVWIGFTGSNGIMALGDVLTGEVNPSGRLVDTWPTDFAKDPTFINFGTGAEADTTDKYDQGMYYSVDYEEGIYAGYRYYETRGYTDGEEWYEANVQYPFGYGLSYTEFAWEVGDASAVQIAKDEIITVDVKVTNTGDAAGKEVVQLYATAPYSEGGIEKAHKVLVGYAKTGLLEPGKSETVTVSFDPYNLASYDYRDANANGFAGYELEAGEYTLWVSRNAHEVEKDIAVKLAEGILWETDPVTGNVVENRYTGAEDWLDSDWQLDTVLSRSDWEGTWPTAQTAQTHAGTAELYEQIKNTEHNNPTDFDEVEYPWFDAEIVDTLRDLLEGVAPTDSYKPLVAYDDERWEAVMDACTEDELLDLINNGSYHTLAIERLGLPATVHGDGPAGFTCFMNRNQVNGTCQYVSEPVMAATWNVPLMEELGRVMGEEGIIGDSATGQPYSSIYAPGVNLHRSPFGGRCSEYFSEDPYLSGIMAAAEIRGLQSKGVIPMVKHFVANEQETHRSINGDLSWLTEQSLRELYLKSFEIAIKEGESRGIMSSFNRIGTRWTGGDYRLLTEILRDEWGFKGTVICDFNTIPQYMVPKMMYYAGGDLDLATLTTSMWMDADTSETGDAVVLRNAARHVMYSLVNSNAMNAEVVGYDAPIWHGYLVILDVAIGTLAVLWLVFALVVRHKKNKKLQA